MADIAAREQRILLTRDVNLLKRRQLVEVLQRFGPLDLRPFSRCPRCNGPLVTTTVADIATQLLPHTRESYDRFERCTDCGRPYWRGAHWARLTQAIDEVLADVQSPPGAR